MATTLTIRLDEGIRHTDRGFECAAWWREVVSDAGEFALTFEADPHNSTEPLYTVRLPATVVRDNFQSLWCGNAVGAAYDESRNAGQRREFVARFAVDAFVTDPRFVVTAETLDAWCDAARDALRARYARYRSWLLRELAAHEEAPSDGWGVATPTKFMGETLARLREVETFRAWHRDTWAGRAKGLPVYQGVVWHGYRAK